jgi:predicted aconitase with swiveling domain
LTEREIKVVVKGRGVGTVLKSESALSFLGGIDPNTGIIQDKAHSLFGENVKGRILVMPSSKGSTVGSYIIYAMRKADTAPVAILSRRFDMITATGCVLAKIPLAIVDEDTWNAIDNGDTVEVDANTGILRKSDIPAETIQGKP